MQFGSTAWAFPQITEQVSFIFFGQKPSRAEWFRRLSQLKRAVNVSFITLHIQSHPSPSHQALSRAYFFKFCVGVASRSRAIAQIFSTCRTATANPGYATVSTISNIGSVLSNLPWNLPSSVPLPTYLFPSFHAPPSLHSLHPSLRPFLRPLPPLLSLSRDTTRWSQLRIWGALWAGSGRVRPPNGFDPFRGEK